MIRINHLTKRFGRTCAVDDVSLDIPAGDCVALWGTNGAGKTTIIRCILGLLRYRGHIEINGQCARRRGGKPARKLIGYVPQELGFYDDLGVAEAIAFFARLKGVAIGTGGVTESLARVGLTGHNRKRIRELSGGMKQRLALAIAMLGDPPILILDEVTASLDACGREEFVALLSSLTGSGGGRTMLFASHRVDEVTALARRVVMLEKGRIIDEVPASRFVWRLNDGQQAALHLRMKPGVRDSAILLLRNHGFDPHLNGVGILVPVPMAQKAAPFRVLAEAHISIDDFEIVTARQGLHTHPSADSNHEEAGQ